jgi:hypothetical protein
MGIGTRVALPAVMLGVLAGCRAADRTAGVASTHAALGQPAVWTHVPLLERRQAHAMAALGTKVVMFGGAQNVRIGDTWEWDGAVWTRRTPANSPPPRASHAMATLGNKVVLFGGEGEGAELADTW